MALLTSADWEQMRAEMLEVRADNVVSIALRRGETTLDAQSVRVAGKGYAARKANSEGTRGAQTTVTILGDTDFDVQMDDRFTLDGDLYRVTFVAPNRRAKVSAEAVLEE